MNTEFLKVQADPLQGVALVPLKRAADFVGLEPQTIRNKMNRGEWPLEAVKQGSRNYFWAQDLQNYVASLRTMRAAQRPRRGAPTAAERQAAAKAGLSVPVWRAQQGGQP